VLILQGSRTGFTPGVCMEWCMGHESVFAVCLQQQPMSIVSLDITITLSISTEDWWMRKDEANLILRE
jgi:hypothetical protein